MTGVSTNAGELLVCGGVGGELVALSVADGQPVARTSAGANVLSIATVEPSQDVVVGRDDGSVELWTTSTWTRRWHHDAEAGAYAVGAIGQKLVAQTYDDRVLVLDGDGTLFATIEGAGSILVPFGDGLLVRNGDRLEMRALTGGLIHSWRDPLAHRVEQVGRDRWVVSSWRKRVGTMRIMDGSWRRVATSPIHSRLPFKSHVRWCDAIVGGTADGVLIVWKPWNRSKALPDDSNECSF